MTTWVCLHYLKRHRVGSFKISNDPNFEDKSEAIVGLYLNPPEDAFVLSAEEKCQYFWPTLFSKTLD